MRQTYLSKNDNAMKTLNPVETDLNPAVLGIEAV
jgi:hypothetical protein